MSDMHRPLRVLFVCTANIVRSPYLEHRATQLIDKTRATFSSAGTDSYPGEPMDSHVAALLRERGVSVDGHVSQPLSPDMLERADFVLTATAGHRSELLARRPDLSRKIFTLAQFVGAAEKAGPSADLTQDAFRLRGRPHAEDDLVDPYGRGPGAARAYANLADGLLARLATVLKSTPAAE